MQNPTLLKSTGNISMLEDVYYTYGTHFATKSFLKRNDGKKLLANILTMVMETKRWSAFWLLKWLDLANFEGTVRTNLAVPHGKRTRVRIRKFGFDRESCAFSAMFRLGKYYNAARIISPTICTYIYIHTLSFEVTHVIKFAYNPFPLFILKTACSKPWRM